VKKFSLAAVIAVLIVSSFAASRAFGMPDLTIVATTCGAAQSILNQVKKADTGSRINRGHDYSELLELMFAMNARLSVNRIAAPALTDLASKFEQNLAKFRADYDNYDDILLDTLNVKCANKPADFYNKLETARTARAVLGQDVAILDKNINDYYTQFDYVVKEAGL
jgi:hypothetical protein